MQEFGNEIRLLVYAYDPTVGGPRDLEIADGEIQGDILGLAEHYYSTRPGYKLLRVAGGGHCFIGEIMGEITMA